MTKTATSSDVSRAVERIAALDNTHLFPEARAAFEEARRAALDAIAAACGSSREIPWWADRRNVARLVTVMADDPWPMSEIVRAVEKPWCYEDVYKRSVARVRAS